MRPALHFLVPRLGPVVFILMGAPLLLAVYLDQPPPARTGGFGEQTCQECHWGSVNDPAGSLTLEGLPKSYAPAHKYSLNVTVQHPDLGRGGFQLSARFARGDRTGEQAGHLHPLDESVEILKESNSQVEYAVHTRKASRPAAASTASWSLVWEAPPSSRPVAFHLAANAANDDDSPLGDFIYTLSIVKSATE